MGLLLCLQQLDCIVAVKTRFVAVCVSLTIFLPSANNPLQTENKTKQSKTKTKSPLHLVILIFNVRPHVTKQILQTIVGRYFLNTVVLRTRNLMVVQAYLFIVLKIEQDPSSREF